MLDSQGRISMKLSTSFIRPVLK